MTTMADEHDRDSEHGPVPPRWALACPGPIGHQRVVVREAWFYCRGCNDSYAAVLDRRTGERIPHAVFLQRWGQPRYERTV
jgi:hypothetical protein